jgi:di/tricarboxylate transporter
VGLWLSQGWHGVDAAAVTVAGALVLTAPGVGVISWSEGLKAISWNLLLFLAAALVLGRALTDSGAAQWVTSGLVSWIGHVGSGSELPLLLLTLLVTATAHIYMPSHAARAAALVPPLLYVAAASELDPLALVFLGTIGLDYCSTFPVSSKALMLYQGLDGEPFQAPDLLRLSAALLPLYILLMLLFYFSYWRWLGLAL